MVLTNELRGIIAAKGLSQKLVAEQLGITPKTFYIKMKKAVFDSNEIYKMILLLNIKNPMQIFFANDGACDVTTKEESA